LPTSARLKTRLISATKYGSSWRKIGVVLGGLGEVQQLFAQQIFQRVAKSKPLLYALRGFALFNPSPMTFYP
jgi:hypothetical protein